VGHRPFAAHLEQAAFFARKGGENAVFELLAAVTKLMDGLAEKTGPAGDQNALPDIDFQFKPS